MSTQIYRSRQEYRYPTTFDLGRKAGWVADQGLPSCMTGLCSGMNLRRIWFPIHCLSAISPLYTEFL